MTIGRPLVDGHVVLEAPRNFCLYAPHAVSKTHRFIESIKKCVLLERLPVLLDFKKTRFMSAAAALKLVATVTHCQCCSDLPGEGGENAVRLSLPLGNYRRKLFERPKLLDILKPGGEDKLDRIWNDKENPFKTGNRPGEQFGDYLRWMQSIGMHSPPPRLSSAIQEAYLNVHHHAYQPDAIIPDFLRGRWWQYSYYDADKCKLHFLLLDFGVGIPELVRKNDKEAFVNEGSAIMKAMRPGWTSTGVRGRGRGSANMREPVTRVSEGSSLMVISGKGRYLFVDNGSEVSQETGFDFGGTLIEWALTTREEE